MYMVLANPRYVWFWPTVHMCRVGRNLVCMRCVCKVFRITTAVNKLYSVYAECRFVYLSGSTLFFFITLTLFALRRPTVCCEERPWSASRLWAWLWARSSFYLSGSTLFFYNAHACCVAQTHRLLRGKALECILLVGMAVGKDRFREDAA